MIIPEATRCKKCGYLLVDEEGNWVCNYEDEGKVIDDISDDECPLNNECYV